jgi:subtilisin-like proprotein convertase family protein
MRSQNSQRTKFIVVGILIGSRSPKSQRLRKSSAGIRALRGLASLLLASLFAVTLWLWPSSAQADSPTFTTSQEFGDDSANSIVLGDVDNDGDLDIVTGNEGGQNVIYLNDGTGSFYIGSVNCNTPPVNVRCFGPGSDTTTSVAVGDMDNDGHLDIVVGNAGGQNVVYLNDGLGNFPTSLPDDRARPFGPGTDHTQSVAVGDANGDGYLDIVVGNDGSFSGGGEQNVVYLNDGLGNFPTSLPDDRARPFGPNSQTQDVIVGDLNSDGTLDILIGRLDLSLPVEIYLGNGQGDFLADTRSSFVGPAWSIALGDVNGDSYLDLVVGGDAFSSVEPLGSVYLNDGSGEFSIGGNLPRTDARPADPVTADSLALGDMDGDGDLDVVMGKTGGGVGGTQSVIYLNDGQGNFPMGGVRNYGPGTGQIEAAVVGDVDSDAYLDIVTLNVAYLSDGPDNFSENEVRTIGTVNNVTSVAVGDMNGDAHLDLVTGIFGDSGLLYLNDGNGNFFDSATTSWGSSGSNTYSIAVGDLDGDDDLDIVQGKIAILGSSENQNRLWLNDGLGNFSFNLVEFNFTHDRYNTYDLRLGDMDGDGDLDIVTGNGAGSSQDSSSWQDVVYLNDGIINLFNFAAFSLTPRNFGTGNDDTDSLAVGDMDGDGDLDIVTGDWRKQNVVYLNDGQANFFDSRNFGTGKDRTSSLAVGDVDRDGDLDIVAGNFREQSYIYLNDGRGNFPSNSKFGNGANGAVSVILADVDGDGDLDIVAGNGSGFHRYSSRGELDSLYLNDGTGKFSAGDTQIFGPIEGNTLSAALGDVDEDGTLDLISGNWGAGYNGEGRESLVHLNTIRRAKGLAGNAASVSVTRPMPTGNADFYSSPLALVGPTIPLTYTLFDPEGDPVRRIRAFYSPNGGGQWLPATAVAGTKINNLATGRSWRRAAAETDLPLSLTDGGTISSTLFISEPYEIADLDLWLNITHTLNADLEAILASPSGITTTLFSSGVLTGAGLRGTVFDDQADPWMLATVVPPYAGRHQALAPNAMATFNGEISTGEWTLRLSDSSGRGTGALLSWGVTVRTPPAEHVFTWNAEADLIKSDNVVFRIEAYQGFSGSGPYQHPYASAQTFPFRVEAAEWYAKVVSGTTPIKGAEVYQNGQLLTKSVGSPDLTDQTGLIRLNNPVPSQTLVALAPVQVQTTIRAAHDGWAYRTYLTSLNLDSQGIPQPDTVRQPGQQLVTVRPDDPLVLFNLVVSVEWDAATEYLAMLADAFREASRYLYDVSDGQMAFGRVAIYDEAQNWANADFQFLTQNGVRPYAFVGGLTSLDEAHTIRVGRLWDGDSGNGGDWNKPNGYRTLVHEFGHYALYLYDESFMRQVDCNGSSIVEKAASCTNNDVISPTLTLSTTNASIMFVPYNASELADKTYNWDPNCDCTEQARLNQGESDWETVQRYYGLLHTPTNRGSMMAGPDHFPTELLRFPEIVVNNSGVGDSQTRQLTILNPQRQPIGKALVVLHITTPAGTVAIDQGLTNSQGRIDIYGAVPGNRLSVATFDGSLTGAIVVSAELSYTLILSSPLRSTALAARAVSEVSYLSLTPQSDGTSLYLQVVGLNQGHLPLDAFVAPGEGGGTPQSTVLAYSPAEDAYVGTITLSGVGLGSGRVRVIGSGLPPGGFNSNYNLQQVQAATATTLYSEDGNFELHIPANGILAVKAFATVLPTGYVPEPLPTGKQVIGRAYEVRLSEALTEVEKEGLVRLHYHPGVMGVYTDMAIYYWEASQQAQAGQWQLLGGTVNEMDNAVAVPASRLGIYALMGTAQE